MYSTASSSVLPDLTSGSRPHVMLLVDKYNLGTKWKVLELEGDVERSHI